MTASEKRWLTTYTLIVLAVTTLPYALGFWLQGSAWQFTGFFLGVEDGNSYIAKMLIGTSGEWLFRTPYTAYPQSGFLAFLPYLLLGKLVAPPGQHEQLVALFQVFRWVGGAAMIAATYQVIAFFVEAPRWRKWGTLLATLGGGLGWLAPLGWQDLWGGRIPLEFYSPETFGFLSLFTLPHLALGRALLLWGLLAYWRAYVSPPSRWWMLVNGLIWLGLGLMQPLTVLIAWMLVAIDGGLRLLILLRWKEKIQVIGNWKSGLVNALGMGLISAPLVGYTAISFLTDPFLKNWSEQNLILSPPPLDYLLAYGLLLPLAWLGAKILFKKGQVEGWTILAWVGLIPVLAYFPYNLQRRMPEGTWVALVILAILGASKLRGRQGWIGRAAVYASLGMTILVFAGSLLAVFRVQAPLYRPADEVRAFQSLASADGAFPVVLAAYDTANPLPAWAAARTLIGHGPESIHLQELKPRVTAFFRPETPDDERRALLREFGVEYIFWGPSERALGDWDPAGMPGLERIYQNTTCQVFRVLKEKP